MLNKLTPNKNLYVCFALLALMVACKTSHEATKAPSASRVYTQGVRLQSTFQGSESTQESSTQKLALLGSSISSLQEQIRQIEKKYSEESLEQLSIPIDKLKRRLMQEERLLQAFTPNVEEDDILAMEKRLVRIESRVNQVEENKARFEKYQKSLLEKIRENYSAIAEVRKEDPSGDMSHVIEQIDSLEKRLVIEENRFKQLEGKASLSDLENIAKQLDYIRHRVDKARMYFRNVRGLEIQLEANMLFKSGDYSLSSYGIDRLNTIIQETRKSIQQYKARYPNQKVNLKVKVLGFADKQSFYPNQPEEERIDQNLRISQKRADALGNYIANRVSEQMLGILVHREFKGMGETLPPNVEDGPTRDPKRRVCILSIFMSSE